MGIFDGIKKLAGIEEIDDEDEMDEEDTAAPAARPITPSAPVTRMVPASQISAPASSASQTQITRVSSSTDKYSTGRLKMVVIEPQSFDESPKLVDSLKAKKPVIINLENLETEIARKIFDFLSGATYALNGNVRKVANNIFVFAPENVEVTTNQKPSEAAAKSSSPWKQ